MIYMVLPLKDNTDLVVMDEDGREYERMFPNINVAQEFCSMRVWLMANPARRKTKRGIRRFIAGWLIKAAHQQEAPSRVRMEARVGTNEWRGYGD